jgi:hypothetical protein
MNYASAKYRAESQMALIMFIVWDVTTNLFMHHHRPNHLLASGA